MKRSRFEMKIDALRITAENPDWPLSRIMLTANITPNLHNEILEEFVEAGLVSVKPSSDRRAHPHRYLSITEKGLECIRKWDELKDLAGGT